MANPKTHDSLFKWLITSFTEEFFAHYFPAVRIGKYRFIDKEFISKYEALKESLRGDLFLIMEIEIDELWRDVVIQIEHQSRKQDVSERVFEYVCYAWLLKRKPVWSIVIYADDANWRTQVPDSFWYAFDSRNRNQSYHFDVIKVRAEKSVELIEKHSLLCKLLSLKADDRDADPENLIREIYQFAARMKDQLANEQLLLIGQWVNAYKKIPDQVADRLKKEVKMDIIETTITEHIFNQGEIGGIAKGKIEGKVEGKIEGKIELLEKLFLDGVLSGEQFENAIAPLRAQLGELRQPG